MVALSVTNARKDLYQLIDRMAQEHEPVLIHGKRNSAVLISEDDWRSIQETLYLSSIPGMTESIKEGLKTPVSEMSTELSW